LTPFAAANLVVVERIDVRLWRAKGIDQTHLYRLVAAQMDHHQGSHQISK